MTTQNAHDLIRRFVEAHASLSIRALSVIGGLLVVLLDPDSGLELPGQFQNLRAYDAGGLEIWRAELPTSTSSDCFVALTGGDAHSVSARSFSGYRVTIDPATGHATESEFVK